MGAIIWVVSVDSFTGLENPYAEIREFLRVYAFTISLLVFQKWSKSMQDK